MIFKIFTEFLKNREYDGAFDDSREFEKTLMIIRKCLFENSRKF